MAKIAAEIIAFHLMSDIADVRDGRYQRYTAPAVYVCGDCYFCCPASGQKLPVDVSDKPWGIVGTYYGRAVYRTN